MILEMAITFYIKIYLCEVWEPSQENSARPVKREKHSQATTMWPHVNS